MSETDICVKKRREWVVNIVDGKHKILKGLGLRSSCTYFKEKDFTTNVTPQNDADDILDVVTSMGR